MNKLVVKALIGFMCALSFSVLAVRAETPAIKPATQTAQASNTDPSELIRVAIEGVMATMRENEALNKDNPQKLRQMIEQSALPYLYISRMAQLAMGKNWKLATDVQRETITQEFKTYLIRTYTNTLFSYRYAKPEVLSREDNGNDKTVLKVSVKNDRGNPVVLFLRLEKNQEQWKIVDVSVEGVSLVVTARGSFNDEISQKGIDGFIQSLIDQNKKASANGKE